MNGILFLGSSHIVNGWKCIVLRWIVLTLWVQIAESHHKVSLIHWCYAWPPPDFSSLLSHRRYLGSHIVLKFTFQRVNTQRDSDSLMFSWWKSAWEPEIAQAVKTILPGCWQDPESTSPTFHNKSQDILASPTRRILRQTDFAMVALLKRVNQQTGALLWIEELSGCGGGAELILSPSKDAWAAIWVHGNRMANKNVVLRLSKLEGNFISCRSSQ